MAKLLPRYFVKADRATGEWIGEPKLTDLSNKFVDATSWHAKHDTEAYHFDTYEHEGETRAIQIFWIGR